MEDFRNSLMTAKEIIRKCKDREDLKRHLNNSYTAGKPV